MRTGKRRVNISDRYNMDAQDLIDDGITLWDDFLIMFLKEIQNIPRQMLIGFVSLFAQKKARLFHYKSNVMKDTASESYVIDGNTDFIYRYIKRDEFANLFGGYILSSHVDSPDKEYIGVWGKDKIRKLKRILRQRGATFIVLPGDSLKRVIKTLSRNYKNQTDTGE